MKGYSDDLGRLADRILARCPRDPDAPHYSEETFRRKLRLAAAREARLPPRPAQPAREYLWKVEWEAIFDLAELTGAQARVLAWRLDGWTFEEIGRRRGHSKQGAQSVFRQALRKVLAARERYRYTGLSDVYRSETRRGTSGNGLH